VSLALDFAEREAEHGIDLEQFCDGLTDRAQLIRLLASQASYSAGDQLESVGEGFPARATQETEAYGRAERRLLRASSALVALERVMRGNRAEQAVDDFLRRFVDVV
jgi:hypothetical protein